MNLIIVLLIIVIILLILIGGLLWFGLSDILSNLSDIYLQNDEIKKSIKDLSNQLQVTANKIQ